MRRFHWMLLATLALFLGGVAASAQQGPGSTQDTESQPPCEMPTPTPTKTPATDTTGPAAASPKGYVKDLMNYMMMPSASGVWNAVATVKDVRLRSAKSRTRIMSVRGELGEIRFGRTPVVARKENQRVTRCA